MKKTPCQKCRKYNDCSDPCYFMDRAVNGNVSRKEPLFTEVIRQPDRDIQIKHISKFIDLSDDYNTVLARKIEESRRYKEKHVNEVAQITPYKHRAIAGMVLVDLPVKWISYSFGWDKSGIYKILRKMSKKREG